METYNSLTAWIGWRFFLLGNMLARIFLFRLISRREIGPAMGNIRDGTEYEQQKRIAFGDYITRVDIGDFTRNDMFLLSLLLGTGYSTAVNPFRLAAGPALYAQYTAWGLIVIGCGGLLWAAFIRQYRHWPVSKDEYDMQLSLLRAVGMTAQKPMEIGDAVFIFLMLLVDATMISIVAVDYAADLPRNIQLFGGGSLGVVVAFGLVGITHQTGEQLFRGNHHAKLVNIIRAEKMKSTDKNSSKFEDKIEKFEIPFPIADKRFFSRHGWLVLTLILISLIVGLATYARYNQNKNIFLEQVQNIFQEMKDEEREVSQTLIQQEIENLDTLSTQKLALESNAMIAGISLLAIVFIIVQIVAITLAYRRSFALDGGEDRLAYDRIKQYRQQAQKDKAGKISITRSQRVVINKAREFHSAYIGALRGSAHKENRIDIVAQLDERESYDFESFVRESMK